MTRIIITDTKTFEIKKKKSKIDDNSGQLDKTENETLQL